MQLRPQQIAFQDIYLSISVPFLSKITLHLEQTLSLANKVTSVF